MASTRTLVSFGVGYVPGIFVGAAVVVWCYLLQHTTFTFSSLLVTTSTQYAAQQQQYIDYIHQQQQLLMLQHQQLVDLSSKQQQEQHNNNNPSTTASDPLSAIAAASADNKSHVVDETSYMSHFPGIDEYYAPRFQSVLTLFSPAECERIIRLVEGTFPLSSGRFSQRGVAKENREKEAPKTRVSKATGIPRDDQNFRWIYERVLNKALEMNDATWHYQLPRLLDSELVENIQFAQYNSSELGHYDWHQDHGLDGPSAKRKISITVQMSDPATYEGGNLEIAPASDEIVLGPRDQGAAVVFQSMLLHRVVPVTAGVRRSLVLWLQTLD